MYILLFVFYLLFFIGTHELASLGCFLIVIPIFGTS